MAKKQSSISKNRVPGGWEIRGYTAQIKDALIKGGAVWQPDQVRWFYAGDFLPGVIRDAIRGLSKLPMAEDTPIVPQAPKTTENIPPGIPTNKAVPAPEIPPTAPAITPIPEDTSTEVLHKFYVGQFVQVTDQGLVGVVHRLPQEGSDIFYVSFPDNTKNGGGCYSGGWGATHLSPADIELPERQHEFLFALADRLPLVKNAATRKALRRWGLITTESDWNLIELTAAGQGWVKAHRQEKTAADVAATDRVECPLTLKTSQGDITVTATIVGRLGVHLAIGSDGAWTLTHIGSGMMIGATHNNKDQVIAFAASLADMNFDQFYVDIKAGERRDDFREEFRRRHEVWLNAIVEQKPTPPKKVESVFQPKGKVTPLRQQYLDIKAKYPDAILFFRLGDFYETFDQDAETAAKELDLVLTSRPVNRKDRIPMCGVPYHALDMYVAQLIEKGYHVAVCEQMSEPHGQGLVDREVTRVVTPENHDHMAEVVEAVLL